ncbi:MAG: sugar ABC transporter permease, partial [Lachnospiraceae bacterium]|nr:sugar ABC transporter permease [Lachnospiraceae bacterium]
MKKILNSIGNYFKEFGTAVAKGDIWVKLSLIWMGAGYIARKQIINGIIMTLLEAVFAIMCVGYAAPNLAKFGTLGTVQFEQVFDPLTLTSKVNDYDNSFLILLNSIISLFLIVVFVIVYIANVKTVYRLQQTKENGRHINNFREDIRALFNEKFHITLLTLPCIGVVLMNILPILVLIA